LAGQVIKTGLYRITDRKLRSTNTQEAGFQNGITVLNSPGQLMQIIVVKLV
jgi:hypothetical protein